VQRELLVAKRKKAKELHQKGWSIDKIAHHLVSSWRSVSRWIEMESLEEDNRGWEKGRLRKYDRQVKQRVIDIRQELRATEGYFFGPEVIQANYRNLYPHLEPPTLYFITKTLREAGLTTGGKKKGKNRSQYMNYPKRALDKLGKIVLGIDFVGPRYLKNNSKGVHFLSRKYIRPVQYGLIDRVEGQTTDEALRLLINDWKHHPLPEFIRMDNDPAFGEYNTHPHCIGRFTKVLLNLGITPLYSAPRQPWSNGATEGYNSMFARKFWEQLRFGNEEEIDVAIHQFNMEYERYNQLVGNNVGAEEVKDRVLSADFELPKEYHQGLRKDRAMRIYWLRIVRQQSERARRKDCGTIYLLGDEIELPKQYINQFTLTKLDITQEQLLVMVEVEGKRMEVIKQKRTVVKNANFIN
jgi:hypothetical protein